MLCFSTRKLESALRKSEEERLKETVKHFCILPKVRIVVAVGFSCNKQTMRPLTASNIHSAGLYIIMSDRFIKAGFRKISRKKYKNVSFYIWFPCSKY